MNVFIVNFSQYEPSDNIVIYSFLLNVHNYGYSFFFLTDEYNFITRLMKY